MELWHNFDKFCLTAFLYVLVSYKIGRKRNSGLKDYSVGGKDESI
jgi:hypothetical protein